MCLKHYVFNNRYNRDDEWSPSITLPGIPSLKAWGQDVHGFYYRSGVDPSRGKPAAYISYLVTQYDINPELYINIVHYDGSVSEFSSFMLEGNVDEYSHTAVEMVGNDIFVLWDEVDPISGTRRLLMTFYKATSENSEEGGTVITFQKGSNVVLDADIPCAGELNYQAIMYPFNYETGSRIYHGAVCWQVNNQTEVYPIQAIGVKFESDEGGTISSAMQPIAISGNPGLYSVSLPKITVEPAYLETNENTVMTVSWRQELPPDSWKIQHRNLLFNEDSPGWLTPSTGTGESSTYSWPPKPYAMASDRGFMRPLAIDRDQATGRLAFVQMANHRINIIDDPAPGSGGSWIAELHNRPDGPFAAFVNNSGSVTRIADTDYKIRRLGWFAVPEINNNSMSLIFRRHRFPNLLNDALLYLGQESLGVSISDTLLEMEMVIDDFSSLYCFVLTENPSTGDRSISWICDGLLYRDATHRDRLTRPYDIEFIPPVWTPTPTSTPPTATPTGLQFTPTPTPPSGLWVADMAGHRIVRMSDRGHVEAETYTEDVTSYTPTWSEYENFGVISPNDVSAAYDGTCWAIDWGRCEVVKIAVNGDIDARTEVCDIPDPDTCFSQTLMIYPVSIDCGGDPAHCFVADYEGNRVFKLTYDISSGTILTEASGAQYYRPKSITVHREYRDNQIYDMVWVADRWSYEPTPSAVYTFTPVPTWTPSPTPTATVPEGDPTNTPLPITPTATPSPTPYPEHQRVSQNQFGEDEFDQEIPCAIPYGLSVISSVDGNTYSFIADRDAGWSADGKNFVRKIELIGGSPPNEIHIGENDGRMITRPVDVEAVRGPPTNTPTPTFTPTSTP